MSPWHRRLAVSLLCVSATACGGSVALDQARSAFTAWHAAMQRGDRDGVRRLVTLGSREYVESISFDRAQAGARLEIRDGRLDGNTAVFRVREAGTRDGPVAGTYVLVREDGDWRVDLVETAGLNSREVALPGPSMKWKFIPVPAVGTPRR